MPSHDGVGCDNGADLREYLVAECFTKNCKSSALIIGKPDSITTELFSKDPVLLLEIIDYSLLLFIEDASNDDAEQLPWVELRSHD